MAQLNESQAEIHPTTAYIPEGNISAAEQAMHHIAQVYFADPESFLTMPVFPPARLKNQDADVLALEAFLASHHLPSLDAMYGLDISDVPLAQFPPSFAQHLAALEKLILGSPLLAYFLALRFTYMTDGIAGKIAGDSLAIMKRRLPEVWYEHIENIHFIISPQSTTGRFYLSNPHAVVSFGTATMDEAMFYMYQFAPAYFRHLHQDAIKTSLLLAFDGVHEIIHNEQYFAGNLRHDPEGITLFHLIREGLAVYITKYCRRREHEDIAAWAEETKDPQLLQLTSMLQVLDDNDLAITTQYVHEITRLEERMQVCQDQCEVALIEARIEQLQNKLYDSQFAYRKQRTLFLLQIGGAPEHVSAFFDCVQKKKLSPTALAVWYGYTAGYVHGLDIFEGLAQQIGIERLLGLDGRWPLALDIDLMSCATMRNNLRLFVQHPELVPMRK